MVLVDKQYFDGLSVTSRRFLDICRSSDFKIGSNIDRLADFLSRNEVIYLENGDSQECDCYSFIPENSINQAVKENILFLEMFAVFEPTPFFFSTFDIEIKRLYSTPFTLFFSENGGIYSSGHAPLDIGTNSCEISTIRSHCYQPLVFVTAAYRVSVYICNNPDGIAMVN